MNIPTNIDKSEQATIIRHLPFLNLNVSLSYLLCFMPLPGSARPMLSKAPPSGDWLVIIHTVEAVAAVEALLLLPCVAAPVIQAEHTQTLPFPAVVTNLLLRHISYLYIISANITSWPSASATVFALRSGFFLSFCVFFGRSQPLTFAAS